MCSLFSYIPIGLAKIESDFIVRSVETGLRRWMLVVAVISVDAYPFLVALCCLIVRRPNLEVATKRLLQVKIWGSFSAMSHVEVCPYSCFWWCGYLCGSWVSFITADEFSVRVIRITSKISVSWSQSLPSVFSCSLSNFFLSMSHGHIIKKM